jgi:RNA polymerase sigma-70 factor (ECF subfamily)
MPTPPLDDELVERIRSRDDASVEAFSQLYERHKQAVFAHAFGILRERAAAEDALQETFLRAHANFEKHDPTRPVSAWLQRIAFNVSMDALRSRRKDENTKQGLILRKGGSAPDDAFECARQDEERGQIKGALSRLPEELSAILVQRHALDMKNDQIADLWKVSTRTVTERLREASALLAQFLKTPGRQGGDS